MVYYHARYPDTGDWVMAPNKGASPDRQKAYAYKSGDKHLKNLAHVFYEHRGLKLRLQQVEIDEEEIGEGGIENG